MGIGFRLTRGLKVLLALVFCVVCYVAICPPYGIERFPQLQVWAKRGQYYNHDGHAVFYRDSLTEDPLAEYKPTLVMLHGFPTSGYDWWKLRVEARDQFRCILIDFLGFGFSDKPWGHKYSIMEQADVVEGLLRHRGIEKFHIISHDYGDTVAQELIARQNEGSLDQSLHISSLFMLNGGIFPEVHKPILMQKLVLNEYTGPLISYLTVKKLFSLSMAKIFGPRTPLTPFEVNEFWFLLTHKNGRQSLHQLQQYIHERKHYRDRWVGALQSTDVPLAFVNGPHDPISGKHMYDRFVELIPEGTAILLDDHIGHYPQLEAPEAVRNAFFSFQRDVGVRCRQVVDDQATDAAATLHGTVEEAIAAASGVEAPEIPESMVLHGDAAGEEEWSFDATQNDNDLTSLEERGGNIEFVADDGAHAGDKEEADEITSAMDSDEVDDGSSGSGGETTDSSSDGEVPED
eukprot:Rmarinus@m.24826